MCVCVLRLGLLASLLFPFMPETSRAICSQVNVTLIPLNAE